MLDFIFIIIGIILIIGIIAGICLAIHKRKAIAVDYKSMVDLIEQWKTAEDRYIKELAWYNKVKEFYKQRVLKTKRMLPVGVSKVEHYNDIIAEAYYSAMSINATYFIVAANWLTIFSFATDFEMTRNMPIQGSYVAGTYKGLPIIVSPCLGSFEMICGAEAPAPEYNTAAIDMNKFMFIKLED
jgi:hypothetical protein